MYIICVVFVQQQSVFLLDTCFWRNSAIIFYLTYPMDYPIIWAMKAREFITVTKYEEINRGVASHNYASLAGMLVATVQWGAKSIKTNTSFALDILEKALEENGKVNDVVKRYNRRFNAESKKV